ncbi:TRAP transporter permease [Ahrensia kielensis]|uniref:TRAP transporter permease n=1 Tax=Ahrensia kielensis TaxID=76980 RepID=UPI00037D9B83|nr:TRAP transporter fused permease subunit [Ahrensia kielensis]
MKYISYAIGLLITLVGLVNVMPTYDVLPRIGPFELAWYRPFLYWLCVMGVLTVIWMNRPSKFNSIMTVICVALTSYACWDSYRIGLILEDSVFFFSNREMWISLAALAVTLYLGLRLWGLPIAIIGALAALYLTTGQYWPGVMRTGTGDLTEIISGNLWYSIDQGILGNILGVVSTTVLPFIVLGAVLEGIGAGSSMIRIAFYYMRRMRGGPAYAAIASSALFGAVSGSAVANVVGTGVVTIPMIKKRGFSSEFSGAVEAAASTGGQILPPIMGAAALIMADIVGVSYVTVMKVAIIPAIAYYASLFLTVSFEAQRLKIKVTAVEDTPVPRTQDWVNLILVFAPLATIVWLLLRGMSPAGASISAIFLLIPLSFINEDVRKSPARLVTSLSNGGVTVARLISATAIVGVVVATLSATGLPSKLSVLLLDAASNALIIALMISAVGCIVLGMGMPTLPAYIAIIAVMGTTLQKMGLDLLTAHMFVFTFGVASVITPPVAIASYAAAAIAGGKPIKTSVQSSRVGAMIFLLPFAFVYNPALTLGGSGPVPPFFEIIIALVFLSFAMYLVSSALIGVDRQPLSRVERLTTLVLGLVLISGQPIIPWIALLLGAAFILRRYYSPKSLNSDAIAK